MSSPSDYNTALDRATKKNIPANSSSNIDGIPENNVLPIISKGLSRNTDKFLDNQKVIIDGNSALRMKIILNLGYFFRGYNKDHYYWELVMFSRKFFLIFIGVFTEFFPRNYATVYLVVITFYMYFQVISKLY